MESLGFIASRKFILLAFERRFEILTNGMTVVLENARKAHKLNEVHLISAIGNYYKMTDIYQYILKLNDLGHNGTFDQIIEDLNDVFNTSKSSIIKDLEELQKIVPRFVDKNDVVRNEIFEFLKDKPHLAMLLSETSGAVNASHPALTQVLLFGWDKALIKTRIAHYLSIASNLSGGEFSMESGCYYVRFVSSSKGSHETQKVEGETMKKLASIVTAGWDESTEAITSIIEKFKGQLTEGLNAITPYSKSSDVIFYELSHRTNFTFLEPDVELFKIDFKKK